MRKLFLIATLLGLATTAFAQESKVTNIFNYLSPEMAKFSFELGTIPHYHKRNFESFRIALKENQRVYQELPYHPEANICSINIPARELMIANTKYTKQLNDYYQENYLFEALLKSLIDEAIENKCDFTD